MKWNSLKALTVAATALLASSLALAGPDLGEAQQQATNWHAIIMFGIFVGFTLLITNGQQNKPPTLLTSTQQVAGSQVSKMV